MILIFFFLVKLFYFFWYLLLEIIDLCQLVDDYCYIWRYFLILTFYWYLLFWVEWYVFRENNFFFWLWIFEVFIRELEVHALRMNLILVDNPFISIFSQLYHFYCLIFYWTVYLWVCIYLYVYFYSFFSFFLLIYDRFMTHLFYLISQNYLFFFFYVSKNVLKHFFSIPIIFVKLTQIIL